jgi:nucleoid DNA-binding protein
LLVWKQMRKSELATRLAKQSGLSTAEAADQLDRVVSQIITHLKKGESARLPGLGKFKPGPKWNFQFERQGGKETPRRGKR